jgi:hypothetical protein
MQHTVYLQEFGRTEMAVVFDGKRDFYNKKMINLAV